jgi:hypothetical protein
MNQTYCRYVADRYEVGNRKQDAGTAGQAVIDEKPGLKQERIRKDTEKSMDDMKTP